MKAVIKRLVSSVLLVLILVASVPASLVSALDFDFGNIDWDIIGDMMDIPDDKLEDLKNLVESLDESQLDEIISQAMSQMAESSAPSDESEESDGSDTSEEAGGSDLPSLPIMKPVAILGASGGSLSTTFCSSLNEAIGKAASSEVIFVMNDSAMDETVNAPCQLIFDKSVDVSKFKVGDDLAVIEGSYTFGSTVYPLYMVKRVSSALNSAVKDLDEADGSFSAELERDPENGDLYNLTVSVDAAEAQALMAGAKETVNEVLTSFMPLFPLFDDIVLDGNELYCGETDNESFNVSAIDMLVNKILTDKRMDGGIYQMAFDANSNVLYSFPMTMTYQKAEGVVARAAADKVVTMIVEIKVNATDDQMKMIKAAMRKSYARVDIAASGSVYDIDVNAIGLFRAIAERADLEDLYNNVGNESIRKALRKAIDNGLNIDDVYDIVTEDGLRALLDDIKVEWICKAIMAYNGDVYSDVAEKLQSIVGRYMQTDEYAANKDNYLGDCYVGNGVYEFSFSGAYDYSGMLKEIAESTSSFGYDYAKLLDMCKNDTNVVRTFNVAITAYKTTRLESANDVIEGVLDSLDAVSGDTAYAIERTYSDGIISGINLVLQPGSADEILDVLTKSAVLDAMMSVVPVCLVFEESAINGKTVYDRDGSIAWKDTVIGLAKDYPITFTYIAELETKTVLTFDLYLDTGDVSLEIPVSITLGISDENFDRIRKVAAKLADIITVDGDLSSDEDGFSASVDVTVDLRDYLDFVLGLVALEDLEEDTYRSVRDQLHQLSLQDVLDNLTLSRLEPVAEKAGVSEQFNQLVVKLANRFGIDTTAPCNYKDLIAVLDANHYYQTYIKERLESVLDRVDYETVMSTKIGDFYQNDGTYSVSLGENFDGVVGGDYIDRALDALLAKFDGEYAEKFETALSHFGYDSTEALVDAIKNRYAEYYYAKYDLDVKATVLLFHVYKVTFVDGEDNTTLDEQYIVAGDDAERPLDYHGGPFYYLLDGEIANVTEDRTVYIRKHYDADGNLLDADWIETVVVDATCTQDGSKKVFCSYCGTVFSDETIAALGHAWSDWEVTTEPTCTEPGEETHTCGNEGCPVGKETRPVSATGHTYSDWEIVTDPAATCLEFVKEIHVCTACGHSETRDTENYGEHKYGEWETVPGATCLELVKKIHVCEVCGHSETQDTENYGEHAYEVIETIDATCTNGGYTIKHCAVCCEIVVEPTGEALGHDPSKVDYVTPTCKDDGWVTFECDECDFSYTVVLPATGIHSSSDWQITDYATCTAPGTKVKTCTVCGEKLAEEEIPATGHNYGAPEYTWSNVNARSNGTITCTGSVTCLNDEGHCDPQTRVISVTVEAYKDEEASSKPTCLVLGVDVYVADFSNEVNGQYFTEQKQQNVLAKLDHHEFGDWVIVREASCTESTLQQRICSGCGYIEENDLQDAWGHTWGEWDEVVAATCTTDGSQTRECADCDATETEGIPALGHKWIEKTIDATCTEPGSRNNVCETCGETEQLEVICAPGHTWSEWSNSTATCETDGIETRTCSVCLEEETRNVVKTGHVWSEWVETKAPTCTEDGEEKHVCSSCDKEETRAISALGHSCSWIVDEEATCTKPGKEHYICTVCEDPSTREDRVIPATGHKWGEWTPVEGKKATCETDGEEMHVCSECGNTETRVVSATGHTWGEWVVEDATATQDGKEVRTCTVCGATQEKIIPATGKHTWSDWMPVEGKEATCTQSGEEIRYCTDEGCDAEMTREVPALGHSYGGEWIPVEGDEATCTEAGTEIRYCINGCGDYTSREVPALGHVLGDWTVTKEPTCTETGTETRICKNCNDETTKEERTLAALGHVWSEWKVEKAPTCTEKGIEIHTCGNENCPIGSETRDLSALGHTWGEWEIVEDANGEKEVRKCTECGETESRPATETGHTWGEWTVTKAPTCTETGLKTHTCTGCGETEERVISALGHAWGAWSNSTATCEADGKEYRSCTNENCDAVDERVAYATGHTWGEWITIDEATCESDGKEEHTCSVCTLTVGRTISATGHAWGEWEQTKAPTCTEDGEETRICGNENCDKEENKDVRSIPALGHDTKWTTVKEATCETDGEEICTCSRCDFTESRVISATGHAWGEWEQTKAPTCTEEGEETRICGNENCDKEENKDVRPISALGHDWTQWEETKAPTCTEDGKKTRKCANCGAIEEQTVSALDHKWSDWTVSTDATCTEEGEETRTCAHCNMTQTRPVAKVDHSTGDWTVTKEPTCSEDGEKSKICSECGQAVETETIAATGIHTAGDWEVSKNATCTEVGEKIKRCTSGGEILERESIPALGHAYVTTEQEGVDCHTPYTKETICSNCGDVKEKSVNSVYYPPLKENAKDVAFLSGIMVVKIEEMNVKTFKENFYCDITVYDNSGKELTDADYVGTNGTFVCGVCGESFTIAVIGDIDGDGVVDTIDYMMIKRYVLGTFELSGAPLAAADVDVSLSVDTIDYMMVKMYVLGNYDFYKNVPDWDEVSKLIVEVE